MNDQSRTSGQVNWVDSLNVTSSPALAGGAVPCDSPAGPMIVLSGRVHVPANLSARLARERGLLMSGTFGQPGSISSASESLQSSLVNKLTQRLNTAGSTLFKLPWKPLVTPLGMPSSLLRASVLRTDDIDCGSRPTPRTPTGGAETGSRKKELGRTKSGGSDLQATAQLAAWQSPTCPTNTNGHQAGNNRFISSVTDNLAPWSTARANKWGFPDSHGSDERPMDFGLMPIGYRAAMESGGPLNPEFSRWLMGYPEEWTCSEGLVTPSSLSKRRRLLKLLVPPSDSDR